MTFFFLDAEDIGLQTGGNVGEGGNVRGMRRSRMKNTNSFNSTYTKPS